MQAHQRLPRSGKPGKVGHPHSFDRFQGPVRSGGMVGFLRRAGGRVTGRAGGPPGVLRGGGARTEECTPLRKRLRVVNTASGRVRLGAARSGPERAGAARSGPDSGAARSGSGRFGVMDTAPDEIRTIRKRPEGQLQETTTTATKGAGRAMGTAMNPPPTRRGLDVGTTDRRRSVSGSGGAGSWPVRGGRGRSVGTMGCD